MEEGDYFYFKIMTNVYSFRANALEMMDQRIKIMNEVISGMKVIKMYTWESSFAKWITRIRE